MINIVKEIGRGMEAKCFLLDDGRVYKKFYIPLRVSTTERFSELMKIKNKNFKFPTELIYDDKNFYGYIMGYVKGDTLFNIFSKIDLNDMIIHAKTFEESIVDISSSDLLLQDFSSKNVMYNDKDGFIGIDTDNYKMNESSLDTNLDYFNRLFITCLSDNIIMNRNTNYVLERANEYRSMKYNTYEIILSVKEYLENIYKMEFSSIEDFNNKIGKRV